MAESREDDELSIPRAALNKMIKELIPRVRVANDARELILNCCTEFIHLVSTEANEICVKHQKKTISPDHVLEALGTLGFGAYKEEAKAVLQEAKAVAAKKRRGSTRLENLGIPEEELLRQQQELFEKARQEQAQLEQQQWLQMQQVLHQQQMAAQLHQQQLQQQQALQAPATTTTAAPADHPPPPHMYTEQSHLSQQQLGAVSQPGSLPFPPFPPPSNNEDDDYS